jgi:ribosomal protein L7/L12
VIGLETKDLTEDSVRAMVAAGRKIDAIRLLRIRNRLGLKEAKVEVERLSRP